MTLTDFSTNLGFGVGVFTSIPIIIGLKYWKKFDKSIQIFLWYLIIVLFLEIFSEILRKLFLSNYFLYYFLSIANVIILSSLRLHIYLDKKLKKQITFLTFISICAILLDLFFITGLKNKINHFSINLSNLFVLLSSVLTFFSIFSSKNNSYPKNVLLSYLTLGLIITFFFKLILTVFKPWLLETELNYPYYFQLDNIVSLFTFLSLLIYSWAFYQIKTHINEN
jgi:hypothetical protein